MPTDTREPIRLIQSGLDKLGHSPGAIDGLWGLRTVRAMKALLAANGRAASVAPPGPLPWITEAKSALGRQEVRDRSWLMDWLKRDGRSLGDPSKNPWCGDFVETCIRMGLPDEPLLGALGTNPYWARNWLRFGQAVQPITGTVLVFERGSGGHVGFAIGQDDTHFYVLGGNQSDAVTVARIAKSRLLGARWPATYPPRQQRLPNMKPGEFLSTTNENLTGEHHAETCNPCLNPPSSDSRWHGVSCQRLCTGVRRGTRDRGDADDWVSYMVSRRQTVKLARTACLR